LKLLPGKPLKVHDEQLIRAVRRWGAVAFHLDAALQERHEMTCRAKRDFAPDVFLQPEPATNRCRPQHFSMRILEAGQPDQGPSEIGTLPGMFKMRQPTLRKNEVLTTLAQDLPIVADVIFGTEDFVVENRPILVKFAQALDKARKELTADRSALEAAAQKLMGLAPEAAKMMEPPITTKPQ
jgi:hypothetical protein